MSEKSKKGKQKRSVKQEKSTFKTKYLFFTKLRSNMSNRYKGFRKSDKFFWLEKMLQKFQAWDSSYKLKPKIIICLIAVFLSFFIFREITDPFLDYREGQIAQRHFVSQNTFEFVDELTTEAKRQIAIESVLPVYDYDHQAISSSIQNFRLAFRKMRSKFSEINRRKSPVRKKFLQKNGEKSQQFQEMKKHFVEALNQEISDEEFKAFIRLRFSRRFERILEHLFSSIELKLIVLSKELLDSDKKGGITINHLNDPFIEPREGVFKDLSSIVDIKKARSQSIKSGEKVFLGKRSTSELVALQVMSRLIIPNLTFNKQETEKRKTAAADELNPVIIKINKGEVIIRYGDTVNERHLAILKHLESLRKDEAFHMRFLFTAIFLTILLYALYVFFQGDFRSHKYTMKDLSVFVILMFGMILMVKGVQFIVLEAILDKFPQIPLEFYYFLLPVAAFPVIIAMVTGRGPALLFVIVLSIVCGILLERDFFLSCYVLISSLIAITLAERIKTRGVIFRMGLITGLLNVIVISCIVANTRNGASLSLLVQDMPWIFWAGFLSGLFSSVIIIALVPIIEFIWGYTTDLRLLELAAMDHPLLKELTVKAPGTYHHSIVIGSLVEKAAEAIGANALLSRVMAYYHDVGKMERPLYFIENQGGGYNRHDALQPHMSAMIIRDHVKKGQELGYKYKLPQLVIDAMSEHHGSSTITYFYNKAKNLAEDPNTVSESDYQYDGKNPQSREAALIMLGDVVEAATRSLADPTPVRLSSVVRNVLNKYFADGHLSECEFTLKDLDLIASSFVDVLIGIYHARIDYGVSITKEIRTKRKGHGNSNSKGSAHKSGNSNVREANSAQSIKEAIRPTGTGGTGIKKS